MLALELESHWNGRSIRARSCDVTWCHMISHDLAWSHMVSHDLAWSRMISHDLTWSRMVSHDLTGCHMIPHDVTWSHMSSHDLTCCHMISIINYISREHKPRSHNQSNSSCWNGKKKKALPFQQLQFVIKTSQYMHSHVTSHALLTMSSTPFTLVGCIILILWAFFEETQCSSPSSSTNWICPVSENLTVAPIGTSNSPPHVWSNQTWSPYSGDGDR